MLLRGDAELVVEGVVPDLLHVVPVGDDAVLDGVAEGEDAALALRLVADVRILLAHAHHHALVTGATDDGGKDGARGVVTGETGLFGGEFGGREEEGERGWAEAEPSSAGSCR